MTDRIKVQWFVPNGMEKRLLRRWSMRKCGAEGANYCEARIELADAPKDMAWGDFPNSAWPTRCEKCNEPFADDDDFQKFNRSIYVCHETGVTCTLNDAPPGACWEASWYSEREGAKDQRGSGYTVGPDGRTLVVRLPDGHDWIIDSRCSNCTRKDDMTHFCWVRHGEPEDGTLHVDKAGDTCSAGAGSIMTENWHGFLHNGYLHT